MRSLKVQETIISMNDPSYSSIPRCFQTFIGDQTPWHDSGLLGEYYVIKLSMSNELIAVSLSSNFKNVAVLKALHTHSTPTQVVSLTMTIRCSQDCVGVYRLCLIDICHTFLLVAHSLFSFSLVRRDWEHYVIPCITQSSVNLSKGLISHNNKKTLMWECRAFN